MINTVHTIHRRLRSVSLALWGLMSLNTLMLTLSLSILVGLGIAGGVIAGWRGPLVLHLIKGLILLTIFIPITRSVFLFLRVIRRAWIARYIERADSELNDALLTVMSADRDGDLGAPEVIDALRVQVARRLFSDPISRWVPLSLLKSGAFTLMGSLSIMIIAMTLSNGELSAAYQLLNESPERLSQRLAYTPLIGDIKLTITPPKYTGLPPSFIEGGSGDFEALVGSVVKVEATLSRRASAAQLWVERARRDPEYIHDQSNQGTSKNLSKSIPLVLDGRQVSAQFEVSDHLKWSVSLIDLQEIEWREAAQRRVAAKSDRAPRVKISAPTTGERVDPAKDLQVTLEAKDDFGLGAATLFIALDSDMENSERLELNGVSGKKWRTRDLVDLRVIQAQGGDRIAIWAEVSDRRGEPHGPQTAKSEVVYLEVDSPEWAHRALLDSLREHLEVQLEALASRLELAYVPQEDADMTLQALLMRWITARQKSQLAQEGFDQLVQKLADDELTPREIYLTFTNHLMKLEDALKQESRQMNGQLAAETDDDQSGDVPLSSLEVKRVETKSAPVELAHEGVIIIIEAMVARMALEEMSKLADELKVARSHIKDLMKIYKDQPSESLKSQIMRELKRFKQKMRAMRDMMAKLQKKLPAEFLNLDGMKSDEVADSLKESESQVNSIEKLLEEGKIEEAMNALDELSNALEEMSQQLQEDMDELHRQTNPELEKALSELMDSTRDLMKAQEELKRDTQAQQTAIDEAMQNTLDRSKPLLDELRAKAERVDEIERGLKLERRGRYIERVRADARKAVDDLKRALNQEMLNEAIDASDRGINEFRRLERLSDPQRYGRRKPRPQSPSQAELKEATRLNREIKETLDEVKKQLASEAEMAQQRAAEAQASAREEKRRQALAESERAREGQPQQGQEGQPQQGQEGQPQQGQEGQPQQGQEGQPQQGQQGQPRQGQQGQPRQGQQGHQRMDSFGSPGDALSHRQSEISQRLKQLRSRLEERRQKIPSLNQVPTEPFEQAQQGSQEAQNQLSESRPGRGLDGQQRVNDALKQVMKGLQQAKKPQQGQKPGQQGQKGGQQRHGPKGRSSNEKVEIPEQDGRGPNAMRKALLDAMKSKPAKGYDDQVKAYYDSLVR